jgi:hypothetical protein
MNTTAAEPGSSADGSAIDFRPTLRYRLSVAWDRLRNRVFWDVYRATEIVPQTGMAHRDHDLFERRIEHLEEQVAQLSRGMTAAAGAVTELTELATGKRP